jgi:hypothetical protein
MSVISVTASDMTDVDALDNPESFQILPPGFLELLELV